MAGKAATGELSTQEKGWTQGLGVGQKGNFKRNSASESKRSPWVDVGGCRDVRVTGCLSCDVCGQKTQVRWQVCNWEQGRAGLRDRLLSQLSASTSRGNAAEKMGEEPREGLRTENGVLGKRRTCGWGKRVGQSGSSVV